MDRQQCQGHGEIGEGRSSGLWRQVISVGRKITLLILTYDLALESKDRLQQRGRAEGLLYVLIGAVRENITELSCTAASA